ncbi:Neuronal membrane glycoprotein M6-a [Manis javanica]|nr:Neuronal membrane glycoprotein M6-a [Manis javanica]
MGCFECCIKCLGGIPYASLIATILLYAGVALFCGCGHEALSGTVNILQTYFEMARATGDTLDVFTMIDIFKYVIYGIAAAFFVYGILLMVEGFFTTGAIKDLYGDFKITTCGRCVSAWFIMLTYLFMLAWLGVTAFTSLPVYMYFNLWTICRNTTLVEGANLCLDLRQFGIVTIGEEKKICTVSENFLRMCESTELNMTFHLFIVALAGAGAAVIAMVHYLMVLSANWAYVKDACRMQKYEDIKSKEEQELHDIHSTRSKERLNAYTGRLIAWSSLGLSRCIGPVRVSDRSARPAPRSPARGSNISRRLHAQQLCDKKRKVISLVLLFTSSVKLSCQKPRDVKENQEKRKRVQRDCGRLEDLMPNPVEIKRQFSLSICHARALPQSLERGFAGKEN